MAKKKAIPVSPSTPTPARKPASAKAPAKKLSPAEDKAARAECRRFLDGFGPIGAAYFADGLSFQQAKKRYREEHAEEHADLTCQTGSTVTADWVLRFRNALKNPQHIQ